LWLRRYAKPALPRNLPATASAPRGMKRKQRAGIFAAGMKRKDGISMTELARGAMAWTGKVAAATAVLAMVGIAAPDARTPGVVTAASPDAAIGA
jgi:hypothetical protein